MRTVDLTIESIAFGGKGVARDNGKAVFVPFAIDGEVVRAEIVREKKQFAEAEIIELKTPSSYRAEPPCPYFGRCGGCTYQHIDYEHQLATKTRQVREVLQRIGKMQAVPMRPIVPSPAFYGYRNRVTVHAANGAIGYFRRDSHQLIDVERCPIAMEEVNRELGDLRASKPVEGHYTLRAQSTPRVFSQTNDAVATALRDLVIEIVPVNQQLLIDAYCGAGFFAKALLGKFERVIGIDWDKFAIEEARKSATEKEQYIAGDVADELAQLPVGRDFKASPARTEPATLIVDPPAVGLSANTRDTILDLAPNTFVYVSCNPATLARDLSILQTRFHIESITPLDMFPQTAEIEVVAHLQLAASTESRLTGNC